MTIAANTTYTFTSGVATDYITITNAAGNTVLGYGTTPLVWPSGSTTGTVRFYLSKDVYCGTDGGDYRFKYVTCNAPIVCGTPSNLSAEDITSQAAKISWTNPTTAMVYSQIYASPNNTPPNENTIPTDTASGNYRILYQLNAQTTYFYWVRTMCETSASAWVYGGTFTTVNTVSPGCNGGTHGLYPLTTYTPACSGTTEVITDYAWRENSRMSV
ncbi:fibronectin type III domain-containing protein [Flavobacterium sp. 3HN19-14]|uniref:fibronectin type III domain-containing protein n=1 Tax=Flavobacterium sp. 3HN19-14 TaxID=3448133 RepID=UPI003EE3806F